MRTDKNMLLREAILDLSARLTTAAMLLSPNGRLSSALDAVGLDDRAQLCIQDLLTDIKDTHGAETTAKWRHADTQETGHWQPGDLSKTYVLALSPTRQIQLTMSQGRNPGQATLISLNNGRYASTLMTAMIPAGYATTVKDAQRIALTALEKQSREAAESALQKHTLLTAAIRDMELRND